MTLQATIATIETAPTRSVLKDALHQIIGNYGFSAFCFLDISEAYRQDFLYFGSTGERWEQEYVQNGFFEVDEVLKVARRTNRPFAWSDVPLPERLGRKISGAQKVFEAANDYKFRSGYVIPLPFVDQIGRYHSALCSLMWSENFKQFEKVRETKATELHLILTYWIQRVVDLSSIEDRPTPIDVMARRRRALEYKLSDRERDVLAWAARGKTSQDTADILGISIETVTVYLKKAMAKIDADNKTHACTKAIMLGLIEP